MNVDIVEIAKHILKEIESKPKVFIPTMEVITQLCEAVVEAEKILSGVSDCEKCSLCSAVADQWLIERSGEK